MEKYEEIQAKYVDISSMRLNINTSLDKLNEKINYIKSTYQKYISNNNNNIFGLDNLFFQNQLLIEEHNNLTNMYKLIEMKEKVEIVEREVKRERKEGERDTFFSHILKN